MTGTTFTRKIRAVPPPSDNTVHLGYSTAARPTAFADMDRVVRPPSREPTPGSQREITHLSLDASWNGSPATGADLFLAEFLENGLVHLPVACAVLRGERLPHGAVFGG